MYLNRLTAICGGDPILARMVAVKGFKGLANEVEDEIDYHSYPSEPIIKYLKSICFLLISPSLTTLNNIFVGASAIPIVGEVMPNSSLI